jgi:cob(I)alamin adenosyltransferase
MAPRLSKIITHTGDDGTTGLADGSRLAKNTARIEAIGSVDELNSVIGIILSHDLSDALSDILFNIQHELFDAGAELATPGRAIITGNHVEHLEKLASDFNDELTPLKEFILPGGTLAASHLHLARTVCRRTERVVITLHDQEKISGDLLKYLNRLSDLLFILARVANKQAGCDDILWNPAKKPGQD